MSQDLDFLQSLKEDELRELVLIPLFGALGYSDIRSTHGILEAGKDIVFARVDPIEGSKYLCATVKAHRLSGSVSNSKAIREIYFQVKQALTEPFVNPTDGLSVAIDKAYVVTPFEISAQCIHSIRAELATGEGKVAFIDGPKLLTLLERYMPSLLRTLPNPEARYLQVLYRQVVEVHSLNVIGGGRRLSIADVYTGGTLAKTTPEDARSISFSKPELTESATDLLSVLAETRFVVVLADVGSGKTTLLHKYILDLVEESVETRPGSPLPVLIPLRALALDSLGDRQSFRAAVEAYVRESTRFSGFRFSTVSTFTLLFDGFDELPGFHDEVCSHIQGLTGLAERIVLTSRPSRIPDLKQPFEFYRLNPFSDEDIQTFLAKWFITDHERRTQVYQRIKSDENLFTFCRTPLMLTLYSVLADRRSLDQLPTRKTDIYQSLSTLLLGEWDVGRQVRNQFSVHLKAHIMEDLAYEMQEMTSTRFSRRHFDQIASDVYKLAGLSADSTAVLNELLFRSGLIRPASGAARDVLEFVHLSFQEYFAAKHLVRASDSKKIDFLLLDNWWKNTLVFYFGVRRSLDGLHIPSRKRTGSTGLRLVECLLEADFTSQSTRERVFEALARDILYSPRLTKRDIELCARFGDDLVAALVHVRGSVVWGKIRGKRFDGLDKSHSGVQPNPANYIKVMVEVGTSKACKSIIDVDGLLELVSVGDLLEAMQAALRQIGEREWLSLVRRIWQAAKNNGVADNERLLLKISQDLRASAAAGGARGANSGKLLSELQRAGLTQ
jgi:hypothetical protein